MEFLWVLTGSQANSNPSPNLYWCLYLVPASILIGQTSHQLDLTQMKDRLLLRLIMTTHLNQECWCKETSRTYRTVGPEDQD